MDWPEEYSESNPGTALATRTISRIPLAAETHRRERGADIGIALVREVRVQARMEQQNRARAGGAVDERRRRNEILELERRRRLNIRRWRRRQAVRPPFAGNRPYRDELGIQRRSPAALASCGELGAESKPVKLMPMVSRN